MRRWRLLILYSLLILCIDVLAWLRLLPRGMARLPGYDLLAHFLLIGLAGTVLHVALERSEVRLGGLSVPVGPVVVALLAVVDELIQLLSPVRSASLGDMAANLAGLACFYALDRLWLRRRGAVTAPE